MAALIPAGIAIVGGILSQRAKGKEARALAESGAASRAQLEPFISPGVEASQTISNALSGGPGALDAFRQFQQSTGFQEELRAGSEAIVGQQATRGLLQSGATLKRQTKFGQDLARGGFTNFLSNLQQQAGRGAAAAGAGAGISERTGAESARTAGAGSGALLEGIGQATRTEGFKNLIGT